MKYILIILFVFTCFNFCIANDLIEKKTLNISQSFSTKMGCYNDKNFIFSSTDMSKLPNKNALYLSIDSNESFTQLDIDSLSSARNNFITQVYKISETETGYLLNQNPDSLNKKTKCFLYVSTNNGKTFDKINLDSISIDGVYINLINMLNFQISANNSKEMYILGKSKTIFTDNNWSTIKVQTNPDSLKNSFFIFDKRFFSTNTKNDSNIDTFNIISQTIENKFIYKNYIFKEAKEIAHPIFSYCFQSLDTGIAFIQYPDFSQLENYFYLNIYKTINAGKTWDLKYKSFSKYEKWLTTFNTNHEKIVIAGENSLLYTTDNGNNWNIIDTIYSKWYNTNSIRILDDNTIYLLANLNDLYKIKYNVTQVDNQNTVNNFSINLYPNPVKNTLNIKFYSKNAQISNIKIFNLLGNLIYYCDSNFENQSNIEIDCTNFLDGKYFLILSEKSFDSIYPFSIIK